MAFFRAILHVEVGRTPVCGRVIAAFCVAMAFVTPACGVPGIACDAPVRGFGDTQTGTVSMDS